MLTEKSLTSRAFMLHLPPFFIVPSSKSCFDFNVYGSVHRNNIRIYIQQDATLHSLFYLETALHVCAHDDG